MAAFVQVVVVEVLGGFVVVLDLLEVLFGVVVVLPLPAVVVLVVLFIVVDFRPPNSETG